MQSIQSVGILSCAKIMGAVYGVLGLLIMPFFLMAILVSTFARGVSGDHTSAGIAIAGGLVFVLFVPIFYGAMGFATGALGAWTYNIAAKRLGGIQIEFRDSIAQLISS